MGGGKAKKLIFLTDYAQLVIGSSNYIAVTRKLNTNKMNPNYLYRGNQRAKNKIYSWELNYSHLSQGNKSWKRDFF